MGWLITGVLIWTAAHYFKRLAPGARASLGNAGKGLVAILSLGAIVLMVIGYRAAPVTVLWELGDWAVRFNNALMLVAILLFGVGSKGSWLASRLRHPMLIGAIIWAVAHLVVNGDAASVVLFGGLGIWASSEIVIINRSEGAWVRPDQVAPGARDVKLLAAWLVMFVVIVAVHFWIGPSPFGA